jgi:hypothetical protein
VVLYFYNVIWVCIVSLGVMKVSSVYIALCFLAIPLSKIIYEVIVSYVVCLPSERFSWFMYCSHDVCIFLVLCVVVLGSFLCSWFVGRIRVVLSVDRASSKFLFMWC